MTSSENSVDYDGYDLIDEQLFIHHGTRHCPQSNQPTQKVENELFITVGGALWKISYKNSYQLSSFLQKYHRLKWLSAELVHFSWADPALYKAEIVLYGKNNDDYVDRIVKEQRYEIAQGVRLFEYYFDNGAERENSVKLFANYFPTFSDQSTEKNICEIDKYREKLYFGLIIRLLKVSSVHPTYSPPNLSTDVDLIVGKERFPINSVYLSACSPVFAAMFQSDMKERNAREIEIKDVHNSAHFGDFLRALLPQSNILPNPKNLLGIAELADRYQVLPLFSTCARLLMHHVEVPLIDRFLFADRHGLKGTKSFFLQSMDTNCLKKFYSDNKSVIDGFPHLVVEILTQLSKTKC